MGKVLNIRSSSSSAPPPQEIILEETIHRKVVIREAKDHLKEETIRRKVVIREAKDPLKVSERVKRTSHGRVELPSPIPKPHSKEKQKPKEEKPKPEKKKGEPQAITVILKVHMHCEACPQKVKKCIRSFKGVESAKPDLKSSRVTVKGVFDPAKLVEYVYKETGKRGVIVKQEPEK